MASLSLDHAQRLIAEALALVSSGDAPVAVAVVDLSGDVIASARMDGVGHCALALAVRKAATAANFKAPIHRLLEMISNDETLMKALGGVPELLLLPGGAPVAIDGKVAGAIGIAGGHYATDQALCDRITAQ